MLARSGETHSIETLYSHFYGEKYGNAFPFGQWEMGALFLELIGASGGIYSWSSAAEFAKGKSSFMYWSLVLTNPISSVLFLGKATDDLFQYVSTELRRPVAALANFIELPSRASLKDKYFKMSIGSALCAIPFAITAYLYPIPGCKSTTCLISTVAHSLLANTILHAISLHFIAQYWYYRLPILPFEKFYQWYKNGRLNENEKAILKLLNRKNDIHKQYKKTVAGFFHAQTEGVVTRYLANNDASPLKSLKGPESSSARFLEMATPPQPVNALNRCIKSTHQFLQNTGAGLIGALFMVWGCSGWIASPIFLASQSMRLSYACLLGGLPAYSTLVLCAFYGKAIFEKIYSYLTTWPADLREKFSIEARMYPKSFAVFILFNLYVSAFAYATAQQLITAVFGAEVWDDYRSASEDAAVPAMQILSFIPLLDLFSAVVRKMTAKFGDQTDEQVVSRLMLASTAIGTRLQQTKGDELISSLNTYSPRQLNIFGLDPDQLQNDTKELAEIKQTEEKLLPPRINPASKFYHQYGALERGSNGYRRLTSQAAIDIPNGLARSPSIQSA